MSLDANCMFTWAAPPMVFTTPCRKILLHLLSMLPSVQAIKCCLIVQEQILLTYAGFHKCLSLHCGTHWHIGTQRQFQDRI